MSITYTDVEQNLRKLSKKIKKKTFIFDFLKCFGTANSILKKLESKFDQDELTSNGQIYFKVIKKDIEKSFDLICKERTFKKNKIRFFMVSNYIDLYAFDTRTKEKIVIPLEEIHYEFEFFMPLAGFEKASIVSESKADAKAAEKMAKLFDMLRIDNSIKTKEEIHSMNVFLSRLLFCFYAEDTDILNQGQFTNAIKSLTKKNGSDTADLLKDLFEVLNVKDRKKCSSSFRTFPYVNGGLFSETISIPTFNLRSRKALIECGTLDWSEINPDIFGSMIQAVVDDSYRGSMGMHYTSITNIMKVIEPLFLTKLNQSFLDLLNTKVKDKTKITNLRALILRISQIKIADMACGSGNFLIIAYKELRLLEIAIIREIRKLEGSNTQHILQMNSVHTSISLKQFYGIEYDDFAHEIAILSLWLTEHQMNQKFKEEFGGVLPTLPLKSYNNIHKDNSLRVDWKEVVPNNGEVYIVGNPPFLGSSMQSTEQKQDMDLIFSKLKKYKNLDYVSCWFAKAIEFIKDSNAEFALVSTSSLCEGDSIGLFWKHYLKDDIEISFAHRPFKWTNNAKNKAGVTCVIIGVRNKNNNTKYLINDDIKTVASNINAYLIDFPNIFISSLTNPLDDRPLMYFGNKASDDGNLVLNEMEKNELIEESSSANTYIKKYIGGNELIHNKKRWCLWITDKNLPQALTIPSIKRRINDVRRFRLKSTAQLTRNNAKIAHKFVQSNAYKGVQSLLIARLSSENRPSLPMDFYDKNTVSSDQNYIIHNCEKYIFALLASNLHTLWVNTVSGKMGTGFRYSNTICYNTFPIPSLNEQKKEELSQLTNLIITERSKLSMSIGEMYKENNMPKSLESAHKKLDLYVEKIYKTASKFKGDITDDNSRLKILFSLFSKMEEKK